MLTNLRIKNFKGWRDTGDLRLAPITVFFGTNSSGKSSIGQFLMMLKQTANSPDRNRVLHPGDDNSPVDLGTLEDIVHQHNFENSISFKLEWQSALEIRDVLTQETFKSESLSFETEITFENNQAISRGFDYVFKDSDFSVGMKPKEKKFDLTGSGFSPVRKAMRVWHLPKPVRFFGFPDELNAYYQNADVLNDLSFDFQNMLQAVTYLGPLREEPKRHYP